MHVKTSSQFNVYIAMRVLIGIEELVFLAVGFMLSDGLSHAQSEERFSQEGKVLLVS